MLNERCSALNESVKTLEDEVQRKTNELTETHDRYSVCTIYSDVYVQCIDTRCGRMERDLRQKRQLLDTQRDKMKMLTQQAADDKEKAVC